MNITIKEPCHENWDAMTPNQQGAFCKSCMKDVVDFSKMQLEEIKAFFNKPQTGKVCGRFEEKQLTALTFDDFFAKFTYWNFAKKFAVIFFFTFGFWLFSNSAVAQNQQMMKGEVAYMPDKTPKKDTVKKIQPINSQNIKMGKIRCTPAVSKKEPAVLGDVAIEDSVPKNIAIENEKMMVGMIVAFPEKTKNTTMDINKNQEQDIVEEKCESMPVTVENAVKSVLPIATDSVISSVEKVTPNESQVNIYPNPTSGIFFIKTNVEQTLSIVDANGKIVLTQNINGASAIDASVLKDGVYNLIIAGDPAEAVIKRRLVIVR